MEQIIKMIKEISATDNLTEARAECLYSGHLFEKHIAPDLKLTPEQMANITFTLGRSCQLGVLFGILWHTDNMADKIELDAKKLYSTALKLGNVTWRKE